MKLRLRPLLVFAVSATASIAAAIHGAGCQQAATNVSMRSLEQSGRVSFVCLGPPNGALPVERPLEECTSQQFTATNDYLDIVDDAGDVDAGTKPTPHLYALVTQTRRGEVAVVDTSSIENAVLDENLAEPGANFLPIGAQPTSIVSTPAGVASFVAVAEPGRAGIFALPSSRIRPSTTAEVDAGTGGGGGGPSGSAAAGGASGVLQLGPALSSWPVCSLPSAPGDMILIADPLVKGQERPTCDEAYADVASSDQISAQEGRGRQKLVVAMPDMGGIIVIDAQTLLNQNKPPGTFAPCIVERWLPLEADLSGYHPPPPTPPHPSGVACVEPEIPTPPLADSYQPRPAGLSYADGKLYVADRAAPVIHVIDMPTPCEPVERAPLLPTSAENPARVVFTTHVSVAPSQTPDFRRFLYATDYDDYSVMVFDVGPTSTSRRPLQRSHPEYTPFQPVDRVRYASPVADVLVVQTDVPETNPITGLSVAGVRCNPDPNVPVCTATSPSCDISANYVTDRSTYQSGAGPLKLRGTFAFVALTSGKVAVIDVDDFDAPCRGPVTMSKLYGCDTNGPSAARNTSWETSCNIVSPNAPRSGYYEVVDNNAGQHVPGIASWPQLFDKDGAGVDPGVGATMVAPKPADSNIPSDPDPALAGTQTGYNISVGSMYPQPICAISCGTDADCAAGCGTCNKNTGRCGDVSNTLAINYEDPRAHSWAEDWYVVFEGAIPGFELRLSRFVAEPKYSTFEVKAAGVEDSSARFCDNGVLGEKAMREIYADALTKKDPSGKVLSDPSDLDWARYADYVQVTSQLPDELDPYWQGRIKQGPDAALEAPDCHLPNSSGYYSYAQCLEEFGTPDAPTYARDMRIVEAYQDHVEVTPRPPACTVVASEGTPAYVSCPENPTDPGLERLRALKCCFPGALSYTVRVGSQWLARGAVSGYLHHVVADPATGACRNSCAAVSQRKNGRALEYGTLDAALPKDGSPLVFVNPMFRFAIASPAPDPTGAPGTSTACGQCGAGQTCVVAQCTPPATPQSCPTAHACVAPQTCLRPDGSACGEAADCACACPPGLHTTPYCTETYNPGSPTWRADGRDQTFRFTTTDPFTPLLVTLSADATAQINPQALAFLPPTGELVVTDGSMNGLIFVSLASSTFSRQYY